MRKSNIFVIFWLVVSLVGCTLPEFSTIPTVTPSNTLTPSASPTQTASPSLTPSPTPTPEIRLSNADHAFFNGDYDFARMEFQSTLTEAVGDQVKSAALWGMARVNYQEKYYDQSLVYLNDLLSKYPNSPNYRQVYFLQGLCYDALKRYSEAARSYANYAEANPGLIDAYVKEFRGDALANAGDYSDASASYQASLQAGRIGDTLALKIKIAKMYALTGDIKSSLTIFNDIAASTSDDYVKAQMDFLIGQTYLNQGQSDLAYSYFLDTVKKYPASFDSYSALVALVDAGVTVDDLDRGLVDYFAGQYGVALDAFNRYLISHPENDGTVLNYLALTLRENGEYQQAIDNWTRLINNYPANLYWESAWTDRAKTMWSYMQNYQVAAESLLDYVSKYPNNNNAAFNLNYAARIQDWDDKLDTASQIWQRLAVEYPGSDLVPDALFNAGIEFYRMAAYDKALVIFQKDMILSSLPSDQARAYLWIGKSQSSLSEKASSQESLQLAANLDPTGYYSERARDLLLGRSIFEASGSYNFKFDIAKERSEAEAWIRITFKLPPETDLTGIDSLASDARFQRGTELWKLGLNDYARNEFEDLRLSVAGNPVDSYRLANHMLDLGFYRIAIASSRQLLKLAGLETYTQMLVAPQYFNHINYGAYFQDLVIPYAEEFHLDPLILFSVISQESSFEGFVHSSAGARGLMQIMPATGQERALTLGWPTNYNSDDLYRPTVSIRLGASYLAKNLIDFNGDYFSTLSAYNAGPVNALFWKNLSGNDPDLFLEVVRLTNSDPYDYIWKIYEIFLVYRSIYGKTP